MRRGSLGVLECLADADTALEQWLGPGNTNKRVREGYYPAGVGGLGSTRYSPPTHTPGTARLDHLTGTPQACSNSTFGSGQGDPRGR